MSTVTRANLVEHLYSRVGLSRHDSSMILESLLGVISDRLEAGESVKLSGFGTFSVRQKGERIGRNPKTGVEVPILPRAVLVFRPSQLLRDRMNGSENGAAAEASSHDR
ncbi:MULTISPECIES: integration host factor subunit alpha [Gluconobacter]|uniref:Integration host factor subunit alpha n=4 Tax=Gluconobacter TaxID=441 RepID=A0A829WN76_GLUOY|nr:MULTISPECIES: integration host factor subunit alpha [Gluconobacter]AHK70047.1 integration host factor subunit alpha [Gluconobacter oxydans DSM 3504]KXV09736.1 integration host factor subunit alpha [Gluconobacter oxydans]MBF0885248.1 integration host factor subunit alpha [Gluconobacter sphaericus]MBS1085054.1 integration host factor subunit alpha [Gluconobacter sphaericus]MBS1096098.1 integration host factor subunit alpha [Gluconobacter sphaericus]